ncbi:MAG TPA: cytochrome b [Acetobacteraceae bacterium]|nr:cytochrome b [Acetobacteraceae bacterium]
MRLANTERHYGAAAITLHWLMAALIATLVALGIYMVRLPDVGFDAKKITLILIHKEIGMVALALVCARLVWRLLNPLPHLAETLPEWQKVAAIFVHLCFYALMFVLPVSGWIMSSAAGIPVSFLGLFTLPDFVPHDDDLFARLQQMHDWLGYLMAVFICVHASAALRHHFVLRDETLRKMLWSSGS